MTELADRCFFFLKTLNVCYFDVHLGLCSCRIQGFVHIPAVRRSQNPFGCAGESFAQEVGHIGFLPMDSTRAGPWIQPNSAGDGNYHFQPPGL